LPPPGGGGDQSFGWGRECVSARMGPAIGPRCVWLTAAREAAL